MNLNDQLDKSDIKGVFEGGTCNFPSGYHVRIFYSKINTIVNPQYQIINADFYALTEK